jgi:TRAP-type C4-dicarboxylate transport system substrate-binding protein
MIGRVGGRGFGIFGFGSTDSVVGAPDRPGDRRARPGPSAPDRDERHKTTGLAPETHNRILGGNYSMTNRPTLVTAIAAAVVAVTTWSLPVQAATVLKMTTCLARNHDYTEAMFATFYKPINAKKTDLRINYLGGPEVTPRQKQAPALKRGLVDLISCPGPYYGGLLPEARLTGVQNRSLEEIRSNGAWDMMQEAWGKGLNAHILAWTGFKGQKFYIYTNFKPKLSTKTGLDLTGVKMRSTGLYNPLLKAMGATTVNMNPSDVYTGLERGVVDGMAWPWGSIGKYGWQRFLKYRIKPSFYGASLLTLINLDKWKSLTQAQRDLLEKQARVYERDSAAIIIKKGVEDDAKLKKVGVKDIELTGAVRTAYLKTIYDAKWAVNDKYKYNVDYKALKRKLYRQPGS